MLKDSNIVHSLRVKKESNKFRDPRSEMPQKGKKREEKKSKKKVHMLVVKGCV